MALFRLFMRWSSTNTGFIMVIWAVLMLKLVSGGVIMFIVSSYYSIIRLCLTTFVSDVSPSPITLDLLFLAKWDLSLQEMVASISESLYSLI